MMKRTPAAVLLGLVVLWPLLMSYDQVGRIFHEYGGLVVIVFVLCHVYAQKSWFIQWRRGRYTRYRWLQAITTIGSIVCFITIMMSAMMISEYALPSIFFGSWIVFFHMLHLLSVHWGFLFVGLHIGLHLDVLRSRFMWWQQLRRTSFFTGIDALLWLMAAYGVVTFINLNIVSYLMGVMHFAWHDETTSSITTVIQYTSMGVLYIRLGRLVAISCRYNRY